MAHNFLLGARVYLSGPMDFVASRADEKKLGWRNRVGDFLKSFGSVVFDPWFKPAVRGMDEYGLEDICLLYTSPSPRDQRGSRMPSSA